jgi:tRNA threonylcarbamoyladenosine biosynthesis protein TsaE
MELHHSTCPEDTAKIAIDFAKTVSPGCVIALCGDLGAGKTTFMRAFASHFGVATNFVNSPTFQYLNIYPGAPPLYHFDLYRLPEGQEGFELFFELGFDEFLSSDGITCIEWAERIKPYLPEKTLLVQLEHVEQSQRIVRIGKL